MFPTLVDQIPSDTSGIPQIPDLSGYKPGNIAVVKHFRNSSTAITRSNGWNELLNTVGATTAGGIWWRLMTGEADDALTLTGGNATGCNLVDEWADHGNAVDLAQFQGSGTNSNPPLLTPWWGVALDVAWQVARFSAGSVQATAAPPNFFNLQTQQAASGTARLATAERYLNAASLDPGTFTNASTAYVACTLAIKPNTTRFFSML